DRLVYAAASRRGRESVLHPAQSARRLRGRELRHVPADHSDSAKSAEGRVASVRAELLPPLPAGGALPRAGRYVDVSRRIPLRRPRRGGRLMEDLFKDAAGRMALGVEAAAVLLIAIGSIGAFARALWWLMPGRHGLGRREIFVRYAVWLMLGLEFELAAD